MGRFGVQFSQVVANTLQNQEMTRREFLKRSGIAVSGAAAGAGALASAVNGAGAQIGVGLETLGILVESEDAIASSPPVQWALGQLTDSLAELKVSGHIVR